MEQSRMDNPETSNIWHITQTENKQNKNTTQKKERRWASRNPQKGGWD